MLWRNGFLLFMAFGAVMATQVDAVPSPPPPPEKLAVVQTFIRASIDKNLSLYAGLLSDQFVGTDAEADKVMMKADWLASLERTFRNKWLQTKILHVFFGYHIVGVSLQYSVMLVEQLTNYPNPPHSDCCTFYRTETLVFDGNKLSKIGRSMPFSTQLSDAGKRTDIPN